MYLQLRHGYWTFTKTLGTNAVAEAEAWYRNNYPGFVKWEQLTVRQVWNEDNRQYRNRCMDSSEITDDHSNQREDGTTTSLPSVKEDDNDVDDDTKNIIIISLSVLSVTLIICVGIFLIFIYLKRKDGPEEPEMEKNEAY